MADTLSKYLIEIDETVKGQKEAESAINGIEKSLGKLDKKTKSLPKLGQQYTKMIESMRQAGLSTGEIKGLAGDFSLSSGAIKLSTEQLKTFQQHLKSSGASGSEIKKITNNLKEMGMVASPTTSKMGDFERALRRAAIVAPVWLALRAAMMGVMNLIRSQTQFLVEFETAMARIRIVGKGTEEEYKNLGITLISLSVAYGVSASKALEAAKIFAQQGRTVSETIELTRAAMIGSQVLGDDIVKVVDDMTAAVNAFNIPVTNSASVIDKWINVEKEFAVTSRDLADATKVAGATANQLGISIDKLLGDTTAVIEITRQTGNEAARGIQFAYARLYTTAKKTIETVANIPFYLDASGKATKGWTDTLRPAEEILGELANKWNTLTQEERLQLATSLGSMRQMRTVNALMQNYSRSIDAQIKSLTSAGTAQKALNELQSTAAYKAQQVGSAWNQMTSAIANTEAFKKAQDALKVLLVELTRAANYRIGANIGESEINTEIQTEIDRQGNLIESTLKVIELRDRLMKSPPTDENIKRIELLNEQLNKIKTEFPTIKIPIETGNKEDITKTINDIQNNLLGRRIVSQVNLEFNPKLQEAQKNLTDAVKNAKIAAKELGTNWKEDITLDAPRKTLQDLLDLRKQAIDDKYKEALIQKEINKENKEEIDDEKAASFLEQKKLDMALRFVEIEHAYAGDLAKQLELKYKIVDQDEAIYNDQEKANEKAKIQNQILQERIRIGEENLNHELELARIRGADSKTLLDMEIKMKQQLYPQTKQNELLDYRLKREKEIALEQERQLNISSNAVALMKIAEKFGKGTAFQASQVLTGERGVYNIASDVEAAMKEFMSGEYETIFASDYIRRYGITTPEDIRNQRAERSMRNLEPSPINIKIDIPQINTSVAIASTVDAQGIVTKIVDSVHEELVNPQSKLSKDVNNIFEDYDIQ